MTYTLPPAESAFADLPHAAATDTAELGRIRSQAIEAARRLDAKAFPALLDRVSTIARRHPRNLTVQRLVRDTGYAVRFQERKTRHRLGDLLGVTEQ